jgi:adhesin transport system outer membrane protein
MSSSRSKRDAAAQGLTTANSVNTLYLEQFKAGKRTIFEVLDSNMLIFTMQRNRVNGEFEEMRAQYGILRNLGKLCEMIARE